ncbi:MAG: hypothetical protein ACNS62_22750 [Candidatus Cyclobacteriaceae bacterium M3_2C_046]
MSTHYGLVAFALYILIFLFYQRANVLKQKLELNPYGENDESLVLLSIFYARD